MISGKIKNSYLDLKKNLVGKDWIDNTDVKLKKFSPVDGKLIAEFPAATIPVVDAALDFAEEAF